MDTDRRFDVILFDLEGTLVDFQWPLEVAVGEILQTLSDEGIDPSLFGTGPSYAGIYNKTRDLTASWKTPDAESLFDRLSVIYDTYDRDALRRWQPYGDTRLLLSHLKQNDYQIGLVSNCGTYAVNAVLAKYDLTGYFELVLTRNDVNYLKPHPEGLKMAIKQLKTRADRSLFVGDSLNDIQAARQVAMPSCFLAGGESRVTFETAANATFHISSLSMLADMLH